jgi:2-polyprenyl-3-methyl-5-hydroxy-6-metoxy-1,4-benzoquinol methylase
MIQHMDTTIIQRLNTINRLFYEVTADEFDATRGQAWAGWRGLLPYLEVDEARPVSALRVLDVGCGNGRFGVFLAQHVRRDIAYHGIDSSAALLDHARVALTGVPSLEFTLEQRDIVENPPDSGSYDLVALFGVLHHIPGAHNRLDLLRTLAARVAPGGLLMFACWRFAEYARFRERIVPFPDDLRGEVEPGDYLLDWRRGETAIRYCHHVDDAEHAALVAASGMQELTTYRADGHTGDVNRYSLLYQHAV